MDYKFLVSTLEASVFTQNIKIELTSPSNNPETNHSTGQTQFTSFY